MAWPLVELSGLLDPNVFVTGYTPTGVDVGAEISQVLNKVNETIVGANDLKVDLDAEVSAGLARDGRLDTHDTLIQSALNASSNNTNDINLLEVHAAGDGTDHSAVVANADAIAILQGVTQLVTTGDESTFPYSAYGGYNQIVFNDQSARQIWGMYLPTGEGWSLGHTIYLICRNPYGTRLYLSQGLVPGASGSVHMKDGDVVRATVANDTEDAGAHRWALSLLPRFDLVSSFKELTATENYTLLTGFPYTSFIVSGQAGGEEATVTLPEITDDMVGIELKGFLHGSGSDGLTFACSGTDEFLDLDGSTGTSMNIDGTPYSRITMTALPAVGGVYRWALNVIGSV